MIVTQQTKVFQPITIVIETEQEFYVITEALHRFKPLCIPDQKTAEYMLRELTKPM